MPEADESFSNQDANALKKGYSFCIITDGRRPALLFEEVHSIHALNLPDYEIIVVGTAPVQLGASVKFIKAPELASAGRLGAMRNMACRAARFDRLIVADDDMRFHEDFISGIAAFGDAFDVLCVRLLNPDGTRFWDWATYGGPRGHELLDYDETDPFVYVTGGLAIMKTAVHARVPWDDERGFYQGEDVEWSARLRAAGMKIRMCQSSTVTHQDPRYSQVGRVLRFRQNLTLPERLAPGIDGVGVFRDRIDDARWLTDHAELRVQQQDGAGRELHFSLLSFADASDPIPTTVTVSINGVELGPVTLIGTQSKALSLSLPSDGDSCIVLRSDRSIPGTNVGIEDERPVSMLIYATALV